MVTALTGAQSVGGVRQICGMDHRERRAITSTKGKTSSLLAAKMDHSEHMASTVEIPGVLVGLTSQFFTPRVKDKA